ncbi:MAG TPA: hypothetical protein PLL71_01265 [Agriterribacter sp.]|nr:hypothetical protein [Agriterribacter sp.]
MIGRAGIENGNNNDWQLWQQHNKPLGILNSEMFYQKLKYIHVNPVGAGFVEKAEDYIQQCKRFLR